MSTDQIKAKPPRGLMRWFYRMPIWLYRLRLGWLMGDRAILLTHTGRKTGLPRHAVLEVIRHDEEEDVYFISSGFGPKSDWFRNVQKTPQVTVSVGRRKYPALAVRLSKEEAGDEIVDYARRHPAAIKNLGRLLLGYQPDGTEEGYRALGEALPVFALRPDLERNP